MSVFSRIKNLFFSCTSQLTQAAEDRPLFRVIRERRISRILEIGVGNGERSLRLLQAAVRHRPVGGVHFTGIDLFEARPIAGTGISLKQAHRKLSGCGARVRLVPGDPLAALSCIANSLLGTQLVVISLDQIGESLDRAWFYLPRLLAVDAAVFIERAAADSEEPIPQPLSRIEVEALAAKARPRRVAA